MVKSKHTVIPGGATELFYSKESDDPRCVGYLRGDFGDGHEFWTSWWPHNDDRFNTQEFKDDFYPLVSVLRKNLLKNRAGMFKYIADHPVSPLSDDSPRAYGYHVLTERYAYYIRCTPERGNYNFYIYCYLMEGDV